MKIYLYIRLVLLTTFAVLIGVFSHQLLEYLPFLVGAVITLYGVECFVFSYYQKGKKLYQDYQFYLGGIQILLGIVMMSAVREFNTICVIWGTWTIVRESYELYEVSHKFYHHRFPALFSLVTSIVEIVFSVLLILYASEHHALTHIYLLIPEFIVIGISPITFEIYKKRRKHKKEQNQ